MCRLLAPLACLLLAAPARADDPPIVAAVKAKVKADQPFSMFITFKVKAGQNAAFEAAMAAAVKETVKETGNVAYQLNHDPDHPEVYVLYERWKTVGDLEKHFKLPHTVELLKAFPAALDGPPQVKVYHTAADK